MQSDLGREGIINSGSYRFADHIYRNQPSGRGLFGRWINALFLAMPATQAFIAGISVRRTSSGESQPKFRLRRPFAFWPFPAGFRAISPSSVTGSMAL
jgi:hypothetical protein